MQMTTSENYNQAYEVALDFLYSYINFESKSLERYHASKMDPNRVYELLASIGDPQDKYPSIHIAGTKGKGSVAVISAWALAKAGYRVGLYTSPHLRDFRERIRIVTPEDNLGMITKDDFAAAVQGLKSKLDIFPDLTWFEIVTALAFRYFADKQVDIAVVEVGLGGRLDATNPLIPLVSVITSLSLDHTNLLGDSLAEIAYEKAGIIKPGVPVILAPQPQEALDKVLEIAQERGSAVSVIGEDWTFGGFNQHLVVTHSPNGSFVSDGTELEVALAGEHQLENAVVALAALEVVRSSFPALNQQVVQQALATVNWDGRLQTVYESSNSPTFLVDSAHNEDSAEKLAAALSHNYEYKRLILIFGTPADKAISGMMSLLFPLAAGIIVAQADHPRATPAEELVRMAQDLGYKAIPAATAREALQTAFSLAEPGDLICGTGSIIFVGDLLNHWESLKSSLIA